jgi:riboflavin synthase
MFTGIIETVGTVREVSHQGANRVFWVESGLADELRPDQSISHNGVCLTVEEVAPPLHRVTAIEETLKKTDLGSWTPGSRINLERCLKIGSRLDGHIVQGHVDTIAVCTAVKEMDGSTEYSFSFDEKFSPLVIEKGSIAVNGISLTCFQTGDGCFSVAIIPYTGDHTNMKDLKKGSTVNIEFDMLGKYAVRNLEWGRSH